MLKSGWINFTSLLNLKIAHTYEHIIRDLNYRVILTIKTIDYTMYYFHYRNNKYDNYLLKENQQFNT